MTSIWSCETSKHWIEMNWIGPQGEPAQRIWEDGAALCGVKRDPRDRLRSHRRPHHQRQCQKLSRVDAPSLRGMIKRGYHNLMLSIKILCTYIIWYVGILASAGERGRPAAVQEDKAKHEGTIHIRGRCPIRLKAFPPSPFETNK